MSTFKQPDPAVVAQEATSSFSTISFHETVLKARSFFLHKKFVECHPQSRLSILAACEDPSTIKTFEYHGQVWPLPQTGQMWLEYELLCKPDVAGYFCVTTSYRNEPNPKPGRHLTIFPMFEFECHGTFEDLKKLEREFVEYMGIQTASTIAEIDYLTACKNYQVSEIGHAEEEKLCNQYGNAVLLSNFPNHSSPFWNMKRDGEIAKK
jgi:hypothetical protein